MLKSVTVSGIHCINEIMPIYTSTEIDLQLVNPFETMLSKIGISLAKLVKDRAKLLYSLKLLEGGAMVHITRRSNE